MSASDINITEQQYTIVKQPYRELYCKVNLLNYQFQIVDELSGVVIDDSWTISATSDIRRTGTLVIAPDNNDAYKIQAGSKIFLDKYVQVYIGIKDNHTDEIIYNNMGIYLINNPTHTFNSTTNTISLQLVDLMAKLTGLRNGYLEGYEYQLKEGQDVREIIIALLADAGFDSYSIEIDDEDYKTIQYDMSIDGTGTVYDILKTINENQYINYQMYFDVNGVFHFKRIPMSKQDTVMVDDDIWQYTYISHDVTTDYESVKNDIIVLGKTHTATQYSNDCTYDDTRHAFVMSCAGIKREKNHMKLAFTTPSDLAPTDPNNQYYINLNNYGYYPIKSNLNNLNSIIYLRPNTYYVVKMQNLPRYDVSLTGAANATTYTLAKPIEGIENDSDILGAYISITAKSMDEAISGGIVIMGYDSENLTLTTNRTLSNTALNGRLTYIYKASDRNKAYWQFMGEYQPRAEVKEENPESPFYVNGSVGKIRIVLSGGDYDNISTTELAYQRAQYELYTRCRLNDSLTLTCLPIYWLDVNWLISIKLPTENKPKLFIIKEISTSGGVNSVQTINLMSFYSFYNNEDEPLLDNNNHYILDNNNDIIVTTEGE